MDCSRATKRVKDIAGQGRWRLTEPHQIGRMPIFRCRWFKTEMQCGRANTVRFAQCRLRLIVRAPYMASAEEWDALQCSYQENPKKIE